MIIDDQDEDEVGDAFCCPICGQQDVDSLQWIDDERVLCATCLTIYFPADSGLMLGLFSRN